MAMAHRFIPRTIDDFIHRHRESMHCIQGDICNLSPRQTRCMQHDKRVIRAWALFDWANSAYSLVISTAIFPPYFLKIAPSQIPIGTYRLSSSALFAFSVTVSYVIVAIVVPLLSGIADYRGMRKQFLKAFTLMGSVACALLFFFDSPSEVWFGIAAFVVATVGHAGSLAFYNAYLPEITSYDQMDRVSAMGFAWGYVGSVLLLLFNLWVIMQPEMFGIRSSTLPVRLAFLSVGLWWWGFSQITFAYLPANRAIAVETRRVLLKGVEELKKVGRRIVANRNLRWYLIAFLFFSAGVQTVIYLASAFAEKELAFGTEELIIVILLLQLVAVAGAYLFAKVSEIWGSKFSLWTMIVIWVGICIGGYALQSKWMFYALAAAVGLVLGGIQSQARSAYAKLVPSRTPDMTSYFGFLDFVAKWSLIIGTFCFGFIDQWTGSMRNSILALAILFVIGGLALIPVRITEIKQIEQGNRLNE